MACSSREVPVAAVNLILAFLGHLSYGQPKVKEEPVSIDVRTRPEGTTKPVDAASEGDTMTRGDRVWVWSATHSRWYSDGEVKKVDVDGSVIVHFNMSHPSVKVVPAHVVPKLIKRIAANYAELGKYSGTLSCRLVKGQGCHQAEKSEIKREVTAVKCEHHIGSARADAAAIQKDHVAVKLERGVKGGRPLRVNRDVESDIVKCNSAFLAGCSILVSPLGGVGMSTARRQLLRSRVREAGGEAPDEWCSEVTHLVVTPNLPRTVLHRVYRGVRKGPKFRGVVSDSWLCDSLTRGQIVDEFRYLWRCPEKVAAKAKAAAKAAEVAVGLTPFEPKLQGADPTTPPSKKRSSIVNSSEAAKRPRAQGHGSGRHEFHEGDWHCPECGHHNFKTRLICYRRECTGAPVSKSGTAMALDDQSNDWFCPKCHTLNFANRSGCWKLECGGVRSHPATEVSSCIAEALAVKPHPPPLPPSCSNLLAAPSDLKERIVEEFRTCGDGFGARGDSWRSWQYKKAEKLVMAAQDLSDDALEHLGLTAKFVQKCQEVRRLGYLPQASTFRQDPDIVALLQLTSIHGVGAKLAQVWLKHGVRTLDDVRAKANTLPSSASGASTGLSNAQRYGLRFVDDFKCPLSRGEVERLAALVERHAFALGLSEPVVPCGGYRAGDEFCKAAHIVVAIPNDRDVTAEAERLLTSLHECGALVADLSRGSSIGAPKAVPLHSGSVSTFTNRPAQVCLCVAQGLPLEGEAFRFRRLDIVLCSKISLPFATIQWTGSDGGLFNRELKRLAAYRGYHLSNTYLTRADREYVRGSNVGEVARSGACIECADEKAVFEALGLPFRSPQDRRVDAEMLAIVAEASKHAGECRKFVKAELDFLKLELKQEVKQEVEHKAKLEQREGRWRQPQWLAETVPSQEQ